MYYDNNPHSLHQNQLHYHIVLLVVLDLNLQDTVLVHYSTDKFYGQVCIWNCGSVIYLYIKTGKISVMFYPVEHHTNLTCFCCED